MPLWLPPLSEVDTVLAEAMQQEVAQRDAGGGLATFNPAELLRRAQPGKRGLWPVLKSASEVRGCLAVSHP